MSKPHPLRITLSGDLGSGKSSVGKRLAASLGIPYYSAGALFREMGQIENLDALRTNLAAENNTAIDFAVDERTRQIDRTVQSFIIDSRMAWHFVRDATKVYLSVSRDTAARRIRSDSTRAGETYEHHAAAVAALGERRSSEAKRYRQLYGVEIADVANYDLFVITDDADVADIAALVLAAARRDIHHKFWLPKARLVPAVPWTPAPSGSGARAAPQPLPLTVAHNFGFYRGAADALHVAVAEAQPFVPYWPEVSEDDPDAVVANAKRTLTPGGLGRWSAKAGVGSAFADLLTPARP